MFNPYAIILGLFAIAGFAVALWAGIKILKGRKTLNWSKVEGVIDHAELSSDSNLHIEYSYTVASRTYRRPLETPGISDTTPELAKRYLERYPVNAKVEVFYNPEQIDQATLTPGPGHDDWLLFVAGMGAMVLGISFLIF